MVSIGLYSDGDNYVSLLDISTMNNLPLKFLENIVISLKLNNLVTSQRGCKNGGYRLVKNPKDIKLTEILNSLDNSILNHEDVYENSIIKNAVDEIVWQQIDQSILKFTDSVTLDDIIQQFKFRLNA
jgi:Rrf2 family protein